LIFAEFARARCHRLFLQRLEAGVAFVDGFRQIGVLEDFTETVSNAQSQ